MFARDGAVVLGIDPGLTRCGYAVLRTDGNAVRPVALGVIRTPASAELPQRLAELKGELVALLQQYRPHAVAVEQVFFQTNVRTAMSVGQASGLALAEAAAFGCDVVPVHPEPGEGLRGRVGRRPEEQVQKMVQARLGLSTPPKPARRPSLTPPARLALTCWPRADAPAGAAAVGR
ncbi:MAG: crossover junction endodeoxyribonuclease RuvC [Ilumatobacteraceae bacterium]